MGWQWLWNKSGKIVKRQNFRENICNLDFNDFFREFELEKRVNEWFDEIFENWSRKTKLKNKFLTKNPWNQRFTNKLHCELISRKKGNDFFFVSFHSLRTSKMNWIFWNQSPKTHSQPWMRSRILKPDCHLRKKICITALVKMKDSLMNCPSNNCYTTNLRKCEVRMRPWTCYSN